MMVIDMGVVLFVGILACPLLAVGSKISADKSLVYGPGLHADIVLPARYFYIQAVDADGKNFTSSPGKDAFSVDFTYSGGRVRVWKEVLDRSDGSFIVRYRIYDTYKDLQVNVFNKGAHVAGSPFVLKGAVYHEGCYCPQPDARVWQEVMHCPASFDQISKDLQPFESVDLNFVRKKAVELYGKHHALCHYAIIDNKVYRKTYGEHVGFSMFMDAWLHSLARKVQLPDVEFFVNLGDWPLVKDKRNPIPVFSWCGSDQTADIVMPTYDLTESSLETLGRVSLDMMSVQGNTGPKWEDKIEKMFFRGRDSCEERLQMTVLGRSKPELFDVALTNFFFFPYDEKKYGPKNQHVSFFDFFKYKYQLNIDGTVAAYRFPYLLVGDALVFKQDSPYYEHFYHELKPYEHYIPVKRNLRDVEQQLKWAKEHDEQARNISRAGQRYARDNLMADRLFCYSYKLLQEYATRQAQKPRVLDGMQLIPQPKDDGQCSCARSGAGNSASSTRPDKSSSKGTEGSSAHDEL